jgi:hypothetical protein
MKKLLLSVALVAASLKGFAQLNPPAPSLELTVDQIRNEHLAPVLDTAGVQLQAVVIHVFDQDFKRYQDFLFKLEYKDLASGKWLVYNNLAAIADVENGYRDRVSLQLPAGYYRAWAQCLRTETTAFEYLTVRRSSNNKDEDTQVTLQMPQRQYWLPEYHPAAAEQKRLKQKYEQKKEWLHSQ